MITWFALRHGGSGRSRVPFERHDRSYGITGRDMAFSGASYWVLFMSSRRWFELRSARTIEEDEILQSGWRGEVEEGSNEKWGGRSRIICHGAVLTKCHKSYDGDGE